MNPTWFKISNAAESDHAEILIYEQIGKDWWTGDGVDAKAFAEKLKDIPKNRPIKLRINSPGGNVWDGLAIYNLLKERSEFVTAYIDGIAASIASIIPLAAKSIVIPKNGLFMIHKPWAAVAGNANDMKEAIRVLDKHEDSLVSIYVQETGQTEEEVKKKMADETWFTGQEAVDFGLADQLTDDVQIAASFDFSRFRNTPKAISGAPAQNSTQQKDTMKRNTLLLNPQAADTAGGGGAAPAGKPAETAITNAANTDLTAINRQLADLNAKLEASRRSNVEMSIDALIGEGRIEAGTREFWLKAAIADEGVIENLKRNPVMAPAEAPVAQIDFVKASAKDICKEMDRLRLPQASFTRGESISVKDRIASATAAANFHQKNRSQMLEIMNANTIGSGNKRQVILQEMIRPFARRILPLRAFSTVFSGIPLEGTNVVEIPYFPLVSTASTDFVAANGYVMGDSTQNTKTITVNKRKYQPIRFDSSELARQPVLNLLKIAEAKAEKLAADVFADVLTVVTNANFGAAASTGLASAFDLTDVIDLKGVADVADWPEVGRSLFLTSAYDVNLLKDSGVKSALNFGSTDPIARGTVRQIEGFDYYMCNYIPANAENLTGFMAFMSAILFAGSPIGPADEVRSQLASYEVVVDPQTGASFEYRLWGNADMDERRQVIEANYGYAAGETTALKRIVSA